MTHPKRRDVEILARLAGGEAVGVPVLASPRLGVERAAAVLCSG